MAATADVLGVPVDELVTSVKNAIKAANVSVTDADRAVAVCSVHLRLNTVLTQTAGGGLDFRVPFSGMTVKFGGAVTPRSTHMMEMTLVPEEEAALIESRVDGDYVEATLVEAIQAVRTVMAHAVDNDVPFTLRASSVELSFGIAEDGTISLGIDGELKDQVTHTMKLTIGRAPHDTHDAIAACP